MNIPPLVSVIIPAYNAQNFIGETIDSILAQSHKNIEIIVTDDGSTDHTAQVVRGYHSKVSYYFQNNSGGCAVPRNTGIKHSTGEFLCFFDADDIMTPERIAHQIDFLGRHPEADLVFCDYRNFNEDGPDPKSHFQTCPRLWPQLSGRRELILANPCQLLAQENFGIAGTFLARRKIVNLENGFDPTLRACEDYHYYYRLARHGKVGVINELGMMRRVHGRNMSSNSFLMLSEGARSRRLLRASEVDPETRKYLARYIAECHSDLAGYHADHRRFLNALRDQVKALLSYFTWPSLWTFFRGVTRTTAIAVGAHHPTSAER